MSVPKLIGLLYFLTITLVKGFGNHLPLRILSLPNRITIQDNIKNNIDTTVYMVVEFQPEFPGGQAAMFNFIQKQSKYPVTNIRNKASEKLFLKLLIEKDGSVSNATVVFSDAGKEREEEAKRIAAKMPKWKPGYQSGRQLRTYFMVPVYFK